MDKDERVRRAERKLRADVDDIMYGFRLSGVEREDVDRLLAERFLARNDSRGKLGGIEPLYMKSRAIDIGLLLLLMMAFQYRELSEESEDE